MAKKSVVNRNLKRQRMVKKYCVVRADLKAILRDPKVSDENREIARARFNALPRDASQARLQNRCRITGRPRGVYRKFGLGRTKLREAVMRGDVPGMVKASW